MASAWASPSSTSRASRGVPELVFGYGSLVAALEAGGSVAELRGYARKWQVAMDNTRDLPGYKYYVHPETGERPAVFVAYLDLAPEPGSSVTGVVFRPDDLEALDDRERNYRRVAVETDPHGPAWAYLGTPDARDRFETGRAAGTAVVARAYYDDVRRTLPQLEPPPVPVIPLRRVEL